MLKLKEKYVRDSLRVCLKAFPTRFKNIPTARALEVLIALGYGNERLWWVGFTDPDRRFEWTINRLSSQPVVEQSLPLARDITNLEFLGGPPTAIKMHKGTLLSLLMDRLLCAMDNVGFKALDEIIPLSESYSSGGGRTWA